MSRFAVLSLGFTRGLWEGESAEDVQRLRQYAEHLDDYVVVANSYKHHRLAPLRLAANFEAIPTNAFCFIDGFVRMLRIGWSVLRSRHISLIQAQDPIFTGLAAALLAQCFGQPMNVCVYGPNVYDPHWLANHWSHRILGRLGRWVLRRAECIQVDGQMTARSLYSAGYSQDRVVVKPMVPANLGSFLAIDRDADADGPVVRLLYVGRLAAQKNLPLLLEVVKALHESGCAPFKLLLVGEGPLETTLRDIVKRDGLESLVEFRGPVPRDEVVRVFAASDVFVLTSDYEGYPRVLMEAAAAALPIVTTAISGSDESVRDGESGFIVPIGSLTELAARIRLLIEDPLLRARQGSVGRDHASARLDPAGNAASQVRVWRQLTALPDAC
jgi:glycosyltransferase involved in cell wall biosynthesis